MNRTRACSAASLLLTLTALAGSARALTAVESVLEGDPALPAATAGSGAAVAISPDGRTLYVAGGADDSLTAIQRDRLTGRFEGAVDVERDGVAGVNGLESAYGVTASPDGRFVYVASLGDAAVSVFETGAAPNLLTFREIQANGIAGVSGLGAPTSIAVAPGGNHIYALSPIDKTIVHFERDGVGLDYRETLNLAIGIPIWLIVSAEGRHVYVSDNAGLRIHILSRNAATGALTLIGSVENDEQVSLVGLGRIVATPDGRFVYAARNGDVLRFARDAGTGALTYQSTRSSGLENDGDLALGPRSLYLAGPGFMNSDLLTRFPRDPTTGILSPSPSGSFTTLPTDDAQIDLATSAEHVIALTVGGTARIDVYSHPLVGGSEIQRDGFAGVSALDGADAIATSPDGRHVYVAGFLDDAVQIFERDPATGALDATGEIRNGVACTDCLDNPNGIAVSPNGAHVYVAASASDAISVFARNAVTGALVWVETEADATSACPLDGPTSVVVSPDGRDVFTTASVGNSFCRFDRDATTGALTSNGFAVGAGPGLLGADDVDVSPDGRSVYVAAVGSDAIVGFARDPVTRALSPLGMFTDDVGVDSLASAAGVAVSRDGLSVYAVGFAGDSVAVFSRNPATGMLTQTAEFVNGVDGVLGLNGPRALEIAPDRRSLVVATEDGAVVFRRDPIDGRLGYAQWHESDDSSEFGELADLARRSQRLPELARRRFRRSLGPRAERDGARRCERRRARNPSQPANPPRAWRERHSRRSTARRMTDPGGAPCVLRRQPAGPPFSAFRLRSLLGPSRRPLRGRPTHSGNLRSERPLLAISRSPLEEGKRTHVQRLCRPDPQRETPGLGRGDRAPDRTGRDPLV